MFTLTVMLGTLKNVARNIQYELPSFACGCFSLFSE
jgi:hypothetical protein